MSNGLDYLDWRGDLTFNFSPINEVDVFLLAMLSAPDYKDIIDETGKEVSISEVSRSYFSNNKDVNTSLGFLQSKYALPLLSKLPETKRFKDIKLCYFSENICQKTIEQFSAVTILLPDGSICLSFRGTDDTIIAWKENFYLATKDSVPAQEDALKYLVKVSSEFDCPIRLCGHSKGGNLAVYAAANAPENIQERIISVYNFDGPGFNLSFIKQKSYENIKDKIFTVLSQNSMIGTLLLPAGNLVYVISDEHGPMAHEGFTWQVKGTRFESSSGLSEVSKTFKDTMANTLSTLSLDEKQTFIDDFFDILLSTGALTISELVNLKKTELLQIAKKLKSDKDITRFSSVMFDELIRLIVDNISAINVNVIKKKE